MGRGFPVPRGPALTRDGESMIRISIGVGMEMIMFPVLGMEQGHGEMESVKLSSVAPKKSKFARTVSKVLHRRTTTGIAPEDGVQKFKSREKVSDGEIGSKRAVSRPESFSINGVQKFKSREKVSDGEIGSKSAVSRPESFSIKSDDKYQENNNNLGVEALVAKLFATISAAKAAYAQLQCAQSPYDVDGIQSADQLVVAELKNLSELKRRYIKRQFDPSPGTALLLAEVEEQKSASKIYEIMGKKLESQLRLKDSEIMYLKEKLEESKRQNQSLEKRLNQSGQLYVLDNLRQPHLSPSHFVAVVHFTVKSIRSFVKLMIDQMKTFGWDLDTAANSILPDVTYWRSDDKCFAFESFVCREMFDAFNIPNFALSNVSLPEKNNLQQFFFKRFTELKSLKAKDYLAQHPKSTFAKFCRAKYLQLVHPRMEASFFGNLQLRTLVSSGELPDSTLFASFAEMAKRVWLLHCLAFSFEPEASIFQVSRGCRFSEVYMESVAEEALVSAYNSYGADPPVAFTVFPGIRIGKTVIQCQVYLSQT